MTWCDKLASQPSVGFLLDPYYGGNETLITSLAPLMATWGTAEKPQFSMSVPEILRLDIQRETGFQYSFDPQKSSVQFQHRMEYKHVSGGLPVAQLISSPKVFSSLLADATEMLIDATLLLPQIGQRHVLRIGVVSTTTVSAEDLPPGILKFIDYFGAPWSGKIEDIGLRITTVIDDQEQYTDRCIHQIASPPGDDALITLTFDWQRILKKKLPIRRRELERACEATQKSALEYLEDLAVGNAFDETA